jgi:hypothetical protein
MRSIFPVIVCSLMLASCATPPIGLPIDSRQFAQNCPASATSIAGGPATPYSCLPGGRESGH